MTREQILEMNPTDAIEYLVKTYKYNDNDNNGEHFYLNHIETIYVGGMNIWQVFVGYVGQLDDGKWADRNQKIGNFKSLQESITSILDFIDREI